MELLSLQKKAIFISTPGQTEQIYLAKRLSKLKWAYSIDQNEFKGSDVVSAAGQFSFSLPQPAYPNEHPWLPLMKKLLSPHVVLPQ
jgi:predicted glycosyltransferase